MFIKMDDRELKRFEDGLKTFRIRAYPFATKATVNNGAFAAQKQARQDLGKDMILRNKWTVRSIRVKKTNTLKVSRQMAIVGSTEDYMERQEFGGTVRKKGKVGHPIATSYSAGQPMKAQPRIRLPRKANKLANISLKKRRGKTKGLSKRIKNMVAVRQATKQGGKFVFLDLGKTEGVFKILGRAKRKRIKMVHDLSRDSVGTPRNPWLRPAVNKTKPKMPGFYRDALEFQLRRHRILGF